MELSFPFLEFSFPFWSFPPIFWCPGSPGCSPPRVSRTGIPVFIPHHGMFFVDGFCPKAQLTARGPLGPHFHWNSGIGMGNPWNVPCMREEGLVGSEEEPLSLLHPWLPCFRLFAFLLFCRKSRAWCIPDFPLGEIPGRNEGRAPGQLHPPGSSS